MNEDEQIPAINALFEATVDVARSEGFSEPVIMYGVGRCFAQIILDKAESKTGTPLSERLDQPLAAIRKYMMAEHKEASLTAAEFFNNNRAT